MGTVLQALCCSATRLEQGRPPDASLLSSGCMFMVTSCATMPGSTGRRHASITVRGTVVAPRGLVLPPRSDAFTCRHLSVEQVGGRVSHHVKSSACASVHARECHTAINGTREPLAGANSTTTTGLDLSVFNWNGFCVIPVCQSTDHRV